MKTIRNEEKVLLDTMRELPPYIFIIPNLTVNRSSKARKPLGHKGLRVFDNVSRM